MELDLAAKNPIPLDRIKSSPRTISVNRAFDDILRLDIFLPGFLLLAGRGEPASETHEAS
jgi:hypothetical protein